MFEIRKTDPERMQRVRAIKDRAGDSLALGEEATVLAPSGETRQAKIHKALDDVTGEDLAHAIAAMGDPQRHG